MNCTTIIRAILALFLLACPAALGQGLIGDLIGSKLVDPEVGSYAWYQVTDAQSGQSFFLRQAVVGKERLAWYHLFRRAHWLETELVPSTGFPVVYKMLLTGPASDPGNIRCVIVREGMNAPEILTAEQSGSVAGPPAARRKSLGKEEVSTGEGAMTAEHFVIRDGDDETHLWFNKRVRPTGIVRMKSAAGELVLNRTGSEGRDGQSVISDVVTERALEVSQRSRKSRRDRD